MLYNPDLYKEPSLQNMLAFVETKDPSETYSYADPNICACAQFSHAMGMKHTEWFSQRDINLRTKWGKLDDVAGKRSGSIHTAWTFGALAKRLKKELEKA